MQLPQDLLSFKKIFINISTENIDSLNNLVPNKKRTEFFNDAIKKELCKLQKLKEKMERKKALEELERFRKTAMSKPNSIGTTEEVLRSIRDQRVEHLYNLSSSKE